MTDAGEEQRLKRGGDSSPIDDADVSDRFRKEMRRLASVLSSSECGPLIVAIEVVKMAEEWESKWKRLAGGASHTSSFKKYLGQYTGYFMQRKEAVDALGRDVLSWMSHELAVWMVRNVPEDRRLEMKRALLTHQPFADQRRSGVPVGERQGTDFLRRQLGRPVRHRDGGECANCERLRAQLSALRVENARLKSKM